MPEETRETLCETRGNVEMERYICGIAAYEDFLDTQSPVPKPLHIQTEQPENVGESPVFFSARFSF